MRRALILAVLLAGCGDSTGPGDYAFASHSQAIVLGNSSVSVSIQRSGRELSGSWTAQYCTGGTFNFCTTDAGAVSGTIARGVNPNVALVLEHDACQNGSMNAMYGNGRLSGTVSARVDTGTGCAVVSGAF